MTSEFTGKCLCGAVSFSGRWADVNLRACHCGQCRRWSGHYWAAASVETLDITGEVRWYRSSKEAQRGFCPTCGSSLFWKPDGAELPEVAAGAIEAPSGLALSGHIYVADKGDYYQIADGLEQWQTY
ncbi:GFA family protein [Paracoccus caeni]|uniref:GFA family protein n=1 Tax=Paracoccus caeni TaxID=657651 RepID=A0A934SHC2_9RHOB|nr:GFA family protein [Paracoccus caeni]MBK4214483.1 GFA family protein [Paracoccus caeni]